MSTNLQALDAQQVKQILFPDENIPYLIVAPQYTSMSAGVRVLHTLCHALNMVGERAYISTFPQLVIDAHQGAYVCPDLCTPIINQEILSYFEKQGRSPIVIYLEALRNNPLNATNIVRYALNYPGLLGGDKEYASEEHLFAYSRRIADRMNIGDERILFMPVSDPTIFYPSPEGTARSGSCFYASKYRDFHKGTLLPITANSTEITRYQPDSMNKKQIADLFRRSEVFYTYEDSALIIEAALCGCPVVMLSNEFFTESLGVVEIGTNGLAWGDTAEALAHAKATVHLFPGDYQSVITRFGEQLQSFVAQTQATAKANTRPVTSIKLPSVNRFHTLHYLIDYMQQYGLRRTCMKSVQFLRKFGVAKVIKHAFRNTFQR